MAARTETQAIVVAGRDVVWPRTLTVATCRTAPSALTTP
jgi:hypothetical protein